VNDLDAALSEFEADAHVVHDAADACGAPLDINGVLTAGGRAWWMCSRLNAARDRIAELEAEVSRLRAERARAVERIRERIASCDYTTWERADALALALVDLGVDPDAQDGGKERAG